MSPRPERLQIGHLAVDPLTFPEAVEEISRLVEAKAGGFVFTPNVDHFVLAEDDVAFREAYAKATFSLTDGMPVVWASRFLDVRVPERVSGSDLILPLMEKAAQRGWRVYLLGAAPGVADKAAEVIRQRFPVNIVGTDSPNLKAGQTAAESEPILRRVREAKPDLLLVAFGSPKQETWIAEVASHLTPTVAIGIGAGLDFISGRVPRAPRWMAKAGLEWFYRLSREPRRLWRRYLVNDPRFFGIVVRTRRERRRGGGSPGNNAS